MIVITQLNCTIGFETLYDISNLNPKKCEGHETFYIYLVCQRLRPLDTQVVLEKEFIVTDFGSSSKLHTVDMNLRAKQILIWVWNLFQVICHTVHIWCNVLHTPDFFNFTTNSTFFKAESTLYNQSNILTHHRTFKLLWTCSVYQGFSRALLDLVVDLRLKPIFSTALCKKLITLKVVEIDYRNNHLIFFPKVESKSLIHSVEMNSLPEVLTVLRWPRRPSRRPGGTSSPRKWGSPSPDEAERQHRPQSFHGYCDSVSKQKYYFRS